MDNKRGSAGKIILVVLIVLALGAAVYFTFFFAYSCNDLACFQAHQVECSRAKFIRDGEETTWKYHIKGKSDGGCKIDVGIIQLKKGSIDNANLEGKSMVCTIPIGDLNSPEKDITKCTGPLREELQNLIIQKLHAYVVENLGEIGVELYETVK